MLPREKLLSALEIGPFLLPEIAGQLMAPPVMGLRGRVTPVAHPLGNIVGAAAFDSAHAESRIAQVIEYFAARNVTFTWRVGPITRPHNLGGLLRRAGMVEQQALVGMARTTSDVSDFAGSAISIRAATSQDADVIEHIICQAFPVPKVLATILGRAFLSQAADTRPMTQVYLAIDGDSGQPMAMGCSQYVAGQPVVALVAAATLPAFRGRGAYRALVAHRLRQGARRGAAAAVVQAVEATSAPVLARSGFAPTADVARYSMAVG